jgi:drug/metabolite transporter (DMT)-like permease
MRNAERLIGRRKRSDQAAGILAMLGCALLWSTAGLFIKLIEWQPFAISGIRSAVAAVFLWVVVKKPKFTFSKPQLISAFAYAATMLLFVFANKKTTAANAILLQYGAPVYVAILGSLILKEKPRKEHLLALLAVAVGMIVFFVESLGGGNILGDAVAAIGGITFATNIVFLRKQKDAQPIDSLLLGHIFTALIAGVISLSLPAPRISFLSATAVVAMGIFQIGVPALLFVYGIKRITALESILTAVVEPIFSPVWVFLATGESPGLSAITGGAIIIGAVMSSSIASVRRGLRTVQ